MSLRRQRGQAAVEFAIFTVILILAMFLVVQLAWIGVQKWQFSHYALYTARVWSVHKDDDPTDSLIKVLAIGLVRWNLLDRDYVKIIWVEEDSKSYENPDVTAGGLKFNGITQLMSLYRGQIGETLFDNPIPDSVSSYVPIGSLPTTGLIKYETFIPMEKEPEEHSGNGKDNDCKETPCESGNKR